MGLSRTFPGGITELQAGVWADTGQVSGVNFVSGYGAPSGVGTTAPSETSTPLPKAANAGSLIEPAVACAAVAFAVAVSIILLKKRIKTNK